MIKYLFKKFLFIGLLLLIFGNMQGQSRYPYSYTIEPYQRVIESSYIITYEDKDSFPNEKPDSIWLVVKDTLSPPPDCDDSIAFTIVYFSERDTFAGGAFFKDSVKLKYFSALKLHPWDFEIPTIYIKDTGTTKVITKVTIFRGMHYGNATIKSKIPLREKTLNAIREYEYRKGPEPWVLKKKICKFVIIL